MKRAAGLCLVLGAAAAAFYLSLLLLDAYWNLAEWRPKWDGLTAAFLTTVFGALAALCWLAQVRGTCFLRICSLLIGVALLAAGIYSARSEPLSEGLFGRESPSALWYRGGRLLLMAAPFLFWLTRLRHGKLDGPAEHR